MFRQLRRTIFIVVAALAILMVPGGQSHVPFFAVIGTSTAHAQDNGKPKTLFDLLFKDQKKAAPQNKKVIRKQATTKKKVKPRSTKPKTRTVRQSAPAKTVKKPVAQAAAAASTDEAPTEKYENARTVLVVGDFIADGMTSELEAMFAAAPSVVIDSEISGSSGFVRDDFYDWPAKITSIIEEKNPDILVVLIGANDRQVMRIDGQTEKVRSEAWDKEYQKRVQAFVDAVRESRKGLIWVGTPPFKFRSMSADILAFNEIFRTKTEEAGGVYVDTWDGFVDANGQFSVTGSDIKGQTVRLRAADGINFTRAGREKLAFYVERQIKRTLGDEASPLLTSLAPQSLPIMKLPPLQTESNLRRTNPILFNDPDLDGGSVLLGDINEQQATAAPNPLNAKSVRQRLVEDGLPPPAHPGRADYFQWNPTDPDPTASFTR